MTDLARLARGSAATTVGGVVTAVAGLATVAVVAAALGPAAAGVFGVGVALAAIVVQVGKLGCDTALVHALPRWRRDPALRSSRARLVAGCLVVVAGVGPVAGTAVWATAEPLARLLAGDAPAGPDAVRAVALGIPPTVVGAVALAATRGLGTVRPLVVNDQVAKPLLRLVGVAGVLVTGGGVVAVLTVWSAVAWVLLPWALRALRQEVGPVVGAPAPLDRPNRDRFVRFAGLRLASASVEVVGMNAGLLLVAALLGVTEAGYYTVALRLVLGGYLTLQAVRLAVAPPLSGALHDGDVPTAERLHHSSSAWVVLTAWPFYVLLLVLAPQVLGILGPAFVPGADVLQVLALAGLVAIAAGNVQTVVLMGGLAGTYLGVAVASVAVHVTVLGLLAPAWGGTGAAAGFVAATLVENVVAMVLVRRRLGVRPIGREVVTAAPLALGVVGAGALLVRAVLAAGTGGPAPALAALLLTVLVYGAACWQARSPLALDRLTRRTPRSRPAPQEAP